MKAFKEHYLFVHIPKTAGTSFRVACEKYFGEENCIHDYSPASDKTSYIIKKIIHQEQDFFKLFKLIEKKERIILSGHFHVETYLPLFDSLNIITFVRNPIKQVLSHYRHYCRDLGYKEDLQTFVRDDRFKNLQSRMLLSKPLELYGFIGLTEEYEKSIQMINDYYDFNLSILKENVDDMANDEINSSIIELIQKENSEDIKMYQRVIEIFEKRYEAFQKNQKYQHLLIEENNENFVKGVCIEKNNENPSFVELEGRNGKIVVSAKEFRKEYIYHRVGRNGYIGFHYEY